MTQLSFHDSEYRYDHFSALYKRACEELAKIDINSVADYSRIRSLRNNSVDWEKLLEIEFGFTRNMASLLKNLNRKKNDLTGVSLLIDELVPSLTRGQLAKAIAFSETTYMLREELSVNDVSIIDHEVEVMFGPDISDCLKVLYSHEEDVIRGFITPMPDSVLMIDFDKAIDDRLNVRNFRRRRGLGNPYLYPEELIEAPQILNVSLSGQGLGYSNGHLQAGVVLPSLASLDVDTVRQLRTDLWAEFSNFQAALCSFTREVTATNGNQRLTLLIGEIEHHVARLNSAVTTARRKHLSLSGIAQAICMIFCFSAPPALLRILEGLLTAAAATGVWQLLSEQSLAVEKDPYYFAYRLSQEAKTRAEGYLLG